MSKLNTKDFAAAIGMKIATVRAHISREKLVRDSAGNIDTELEKNRLYIREQTKGKGLYNGEIAKSSSAFAAPSASDEDATPQKKIIFKEERSKEQIARDKVADDIDLRKKKADLNNAERAAELKKLEIQKKAGKLLPIDLVQKILTINIQTIFRTFEGESENVAGIFSEVLGGTRKDLAEIIKRMRESLGIAISKASEDALAEIEHAIAEYTEQRSRGEKKI